MLSRRSLFTSLHRPATTEGRPITFRGTAVFERLLKATTEGGWQKLPIGELMGHVAMCLLHTPYVGKTLEIDLNREFCSVDLNGLDCVTFFENVLDFSRMIKLGQRTPEDMLAQVTFTRYRHGTVTDFASRLHYTTDWFADNVRKRVIRDVTPTLAGAIETHQNVGIMTAQPQLYPQLKGHPGLVEEIRRDEERINSRPHTILPMARVRANEHLIQTGDIIGIATDEPGIDIAHTGLAYRDEAGLLHFMDASSAPKVMKVTLEGELATSILWSDHNTGIIVGRPLEPRVEAQPQPFHHE